MAYLEILVRDSDTEVIAWNADAREKGKFNPPAVGFSVVETSLRIPSGDFYIYLYDGLTVEGKAGAEIPESYKERVEIDKILVRLSNAGIP